LMPELPRRLDTTIVHMLARSPKDRMHSAADARDALDPALVLGGWNPANITVASPSISSGPYRNDPSLQPTMPMPKVRPRHKRVAIGLVIGAGLLVGGVIRWMNNATGAAATAAPVSSPTAAAPAPRADSAASLVVAAVDTTAKLVRPATKDSAKPKTTPRDARKANSGPSAPLSTPSLPITQIPSRGNPDPLDEPVNRVAQAIQSKDTNVVDQAWPGTITSEQHRAFKLLFQNAKTARLSVKPLAGPTTRSDRDATGTLTLELTYHDPVSLSPMTTRYRYDAAWELRADGQWYLKSLTSIP